MSFGSFRRSSVVVGIILLVVFVRLLPNEVWAQRITLLLYLIYFLGLRGITRTPSILMRCLLFFLLYLALMGYGFAFPGQTTIVMSLQGVLISFIALNLPPWTAEILGLSFMLMTFQGLVLYDHQTWATLIRESLLIYVGLFVSFRLIRVRRLRQQEQQRYTEELAEMNAELAETHLKLQQAHEELERASVQSLRYAVLEERSRIARDIHDSIGHRLTSVIVQLQALPYALKNEQGAQSEAIVKSVLDVARGCLQEVRTVVHNLGADETGAGRVSLRSLMQHIAVPSHMDIHLEMGEQAEQEDWPLAVAVVLYRSLQEALTNTIRHANAQRIDIAVVQSEQAVELHYQDDGQLMPGSHWQEGFGLSSIRKRCQDAGGHCTIEARVPHGMAINIWLPLAAGEEH